MLRARVEELETQAQDSEEVITQLREDLRRVTNSRDSLMQHEEDFERKNDAKITSLGQ